MQTRTWFRRWGTVAVLCWSLTLLGADAIPDDDCLQCHGDQDLTKETADGRTVSMFVDLAKLQASRHATNTCASCHVDIGSGHPDDGIAVKPVACSACHQDQAEMYGAGVHGLALARGMPGVPTCADCHGSHEVMPRGSPSSSLHPANLTATCGGCHETAATEVRDSVHGQALARGVRDAPTCTDCHSEHKIETLKTASGSRISEQICSQCHGSERINSRYRMPGDRLKTFLGSYHGLASKLGSTRAANCASCHGVHYILPSGDPRSSIHKDNLVATCGHCHPGATESFVSGKVHTDLTTSEDTGSVVNRWVRAIYLFLIFTTIGLFVVHNGLHWLRHALAARRASGPWVVRMNFAQRWQHMGLALSFIVLAISGFALQYPGSWFALVLGSNEAIRRWSHRAAALVLVGLGLYHIFYACFTREGRQLIRDLWPRFKDATDVAQNVRHLTGATASKPRFGRFSYAEKVEYWAVIWGTIIMAATGFVIWFPVQFTSLLPRWAVDVALTIHYYEAILACLAIIVWHFYHVIFDPGVYPLNWAFWDGRLPKHRQDDEHPLDTAAPVVTDESRPTPPRRD